MTVSVRVAPEGTVLDVAAVALGAGVAVGAAVAATVGDVVAVGAGGFVVVGATVAVGAASAFVGAVADVPAPAQAESRMLMVPNVIISLFTIRICDIFSSSPAADVTRSGDGDKKATLENAGVAQSLAHFLRRHYPDQVTPSSA
jgi:hypothetical protein